MAGKLIGVMACALALCACQTTNDAVTQTPFDAAACYDRDIDVYFDTEGAELSAEAEGVLDVLAEQLDGCTINAVTVIGFAGTRGPEDANEVVSAERAREIADYLVNEHRWSRSVIEVRATGERGAVTDQGIAPMRRRGRLIVDASAPTS